MDNSGCIVSVYVTLYNILIKHFMSFILCEVSMVYSYSL